MKDEKTQLTVPTASQTFLNVLLQPGWYQYVIFEHVNPLGSNQHYRNSMMLKKDGVGTLPHHSGMLFWEQIRWSLLTSGASPIGTRYKYKLFNLEIKEPIYVTIGVYQDTGTTEICVIHFKYSEKKLLEVV